MKIMSAMMRFSLPVHGLHCGWRCLQKRKSLEIEVRHAEVRRERDREKDRERESQKLLYTAMSTISV